MTFSYWEKTNYWPWKRRDKSISACSIHYIQVKTKELMWNSYFVVVVNINNKVILFKEREYLETNYEWFFRKIAKFKCREMCETRNREINTSRKFHVIKVVCHDYKYDWGISLRLICLRWLGRWREKERRREVFYEASILLHTISNSFQNSFKSWKTARPICSKIYH